MIYNGKIHVFYGQNIARCARFTKIGYTTKQIEWCKDYEARYGPIF